jgi:hypothetical protein
MDFPNLMCDNISIKGGVYMRCEYSDGLRVDYSGSLHIRKGEEVNVFINGDFIPANIRGDLDKAVSRNSCEDFRKIAQAVTDTVGSKVCIHE